MKKAPEPPAEPPGPECVYCENLKYFQLLPVAVELTKKRGILDKLEPIGWHYEPTRYLRDAAISKIRCQKG